MINTQNETTKPRGFFNGIIGKLLSIKTVKDSVDARMEARYNKKNKWRCKMMENAHKSAVTKLGRCGRGGVWMLNGFMTRKEIIDYVRECTR